MLFHQEKSSKGIGKFVRITELPAVDTQETVNKLNSMPEKNAPENRNVRKSFFFNELSTPFQFCISHNIARKLKKADKKHATFFYKPNAFFRLSKCKKIPAAP